MSTLTYNKAVNFSLNTFKTLHMFFSIKKNSNNTYPFYGIYMWQYQLEFQGKIY